MNKMTMQEIMRANQNFFSKGAMSFFNSRINGNQPTHYNMFISSEKFDYESPRKYTVRIGIGQNNICTFSDFQEFDKMSKAKKAIKQLTKIFNQITSEGGFLEREILKNAVYATQENEMYVLIGKVDGEDKKLKIDLENMRYTF